MRGVGKTTVARILAKALNCEQGPTSQPCERCPSCEEITKGHSVDVIEIDGASNNKVENIRDLRDNVQYTPTNGRKYKIYIIDEVHMLSGAAWNALLKTLEPPDEPPVEEEGDKDMSTAPSGSTEAPETDVEVPL